MNRILVLLAVFLGLGQLVWAQSPEEHHGASAESGGQPHHFRVYRGSGEPATIDDVIAAAREAKVTFLGETHDDPIAHYLEKLILERSYDTNLILSFEMFERDVQYVLDEYLADQITGQQLVRSARAWHNYPSDYRPLVEFAKEKRMQVLAANAPRRYVDRVSRLGEASLEALSDTAKQYLPPLPYAEASPEYARRFKEVMEHHAPDAGTGTPEGADASPHHPVLPPHHPALPPGHPPIAPPDHTRDLEAQSLWDASMAYSIADALLRRPEARVLNVNGSFHTAHRLGIVDHLNRYRPGVTSIVVTMLSNDSFPDFDAEGMSGQGDFVVVTDPSLPRSYKAEIPEQETEDTK